MIYICRLVGQIGGFRALKFSRLESFRAINILFLIGTIISKAFMDTTLKYSILAKHFRPLD